MMEPGKKRAACPGASRQGAAPGDRLKAFPPGSVRVGGVIGGRIEKTLENNLMVLDIRDDFLKPFRERKAGASYIGLGKLIDAAVCFAANLGGGRIERIKDILSGEAVRCQLENGYIGNFPPRMRVWKLWDVHEISYIIQGLTADYELFGAGASVKAARGAADFLIGKMRGKPEDYPGRGRLAPELSALGLEKALVGLYSATGEGKYLEFCLEQRKLTEWDREIVLGRHGRVEGHAYAYMAKCLAQLELYRIMPDAALLAPTNRLLDFWVRGEGMVITGACGLHECWHNTQEGGGKLGETCASSYSMLLLDSLLRLEGNPVCGDIMERIIYNTLFAAQSECGRHIRYYTPFEGERAFWHMDTYCCPNNYRRIVSKLPGMVYYHSGKDIAVNLYTDSEIEIKTGTAVRLEQKTDYPASDSILIKVILEKPAVFSLKLRIPRWSLRSRVFVNGEAVKKRIRPGSFLCLRRKWEKRDTVKLVMPMPWRFVKGRMSQEGLAALMRGPEVFCLSPERNAGLSGSRLRTLTIDPSSPALSLRKDLGLGGVQCRLRAWTSRGQKMQSPDASVVLTRFPDPGGRAAYFMLSEPDLAEEDELFRQPACENC